MHALDGHPLRIPPSVRALPRRIAVERLHRLGKRSQGSWCQLAPVLSEQRGEHVRVDKARWFIIDYARAVLEPNRV